MKEVAIIGGEILGLAIGNELSLTHLDHKVNIFEKEDESGKHQSSNNSGVLHCGLYYQRGSLKAKLAADEIRGIASFCEKNQINHEVYGKIVMASGGPEIGLLYNLFDRGAKNGLHGLTFLSSGELKEREPNVKAKKVLLVPEEGIVDYKQVMQVLAAHITNSGGKNSTNNIVIGVTSINAKATLLKTKKKEKPFLLAQLYHYQLLNTSFKIIFNSY